MSLELLFDCRLDLGEGPVWHDGALWWVDILSGRLLRGKLGGEIEVIESLGEGPLGAALPALGGEWLLAGKDRLRRWSAGSDSLSEAAQFGEEPPCNRLNDGKVAPDGTVWIGSMHGDAVGTTGTLYSLSTGQEPSPQKTALGISNGLDWDRERGRFYFIDTPTRRIDVFGWRPGQTELDEPLGAIELSSETGSPDGMCIDTDGCLWVAFWGGSQVARVDPAAGTVIERHPLPVSQVTSCCFGGPKLDTLMITTAALDLDEATRALEPEAGSVFALRTGATGYAATLAAI